MVFIQKSLAALFGLVCFVFLAATSVGQVLDIPVPEGTSDESIRRIEERYKDEIKLFGKLLFELDRDRFVQPNDGLVLPIPASADQDSVERVKTNHQNQIEKFSEFLFQMDKARLRPQSDSLSSITKRQAKLNSFLSNWYSELRREYADNTKLAMNYVYFCNAVCPRLSGRIVSVGPNSEHKNVGQALTNAKPGDTLMLERGTIEMGPVPSKQGALQDIEIRGHKSGTTIKGSRAWRNHAKAMNRVRFLGLTYDCQNEELSLGRESRVEFRNCKFSNYGGSAGRSNCLTSTNSIILVEDCDFNGGSEVANQRLGQAFEFRGTGQLYLRKTRFIDNGNLSVGTAVVDRCTMHVSDPKNPWANHQYVSGNLIKIRESDLGRTHVHKNNEFGLAVDDADFVQFFRQRLASEVPTPLSEAKPFVEKLEFDNNLQYWIGLVRSPNPRIRDFAASRVAKLTGLDVNLPEPVEASARKIEEIKRLIQQLDDAKADQREEATEQLKAIGRMATKQIQQAIKSGSPEQKIRCKSILDSFVEVRELAIEQEVGRLLNWLEENQNALQFDEEVGVYKIDSK